jgi:hypothetical protein
MHAKGCISILKKTKRGKVNGCISMQVKTQKLNAFRQEARAHLAIVGEKARREKGCIR